MYKKLLIGTLALVISIFSFSTVFAANEMKDAVNNMGNGVKDVVGGAVNGVEGAAKGISNAAKGATSKVEQTANNVGNSMMENGDNNNTKKDTNNNNNNNRMNSTNYTATRTSTGNETLMGMGATAWTWLIIGIAGIAIIALVWYYSTQLRTSHDSDRD